MSAAKADANKREVVVSGFQKKAGLGKRVAEELELGVFKIACPAGEPLADKSDNYKTYKYQYKRICTHLGRNSSLVQRLVDGQLPAENLPAMDDEALMADVQKNELQQFRQEGLHEALGITAEDSAHWTPSSNYTCPRCENTKCVYITVVKGFHSHDDNNQEPVITIRCTECKHLWKEDEVEGGRVCAGGFVQEVASKVADNRLSASVASGTEARSRPAIWDQARSRDPNWMLPSTKETFAVVNPTSTGRS
ncbi:unnamed protein product [Polarella glacialis]|uniref:TFIIS central domain-containing protein n=1 Tax=Polarella glacialis TaxID=89957 RepID=A0A813HHL5_POLGL|nr:unnamed protein product [Polarella glacialis]